MNDHRTSGIAVIGMACRYPDAGSPDELWENVLSGRRAFRRIPDERTPLADYFSPDWDAEDRFYAPNAALIEGYEFDRVRFRISGSTYRSTDLTHWLALDMAAAALADAGFPDGEGLPRRNTAVIIGNTLTGEFTRAHLMRLRWPYVRRTVAAALRGLAWTDEQLTVFLAGLEKTYKAPFPEVGADSLAGGLANTIAGRICNFFDLGGGGYTVDGACSSSLLSIAHACKALTDGDADIAIAGGVDLSLDPFELVGFAKTSALAGDEMRVYDRRSGGFWPGEGCGMVVLAREEDAQALGRRTYARIAGWGISSDGRGGITRPEVAGQRLALERAYRRAGFGADTAGYIEGHGTGTAVGDVTEIKALTEARYAANPTGPSAVLGTVKANIGHTKAAAGIAGLIKAVMAIDRQVIPPTTGCADPHPELEDAAVRVTGRPEAWPADRPIRAGVSSMGFGGINTHIVLERTQERLPSEPSGLPTEASRLARSAQDAELLTFVASTPEELCAELTTTARLASRSSYANLADLAADLAGRTAERTAERTAGATFRAAVVASDPATAERRLTKLAGLVEAGAHHLFNVEDGLFCGLARRAPRIVLVFPGQGSGRGRTDGALRRRFADVDEFYADLKVPLESPDSGADAVATALAQPRIAAASVAALRVLDRLGIMAHTALGHSLGELTALHWAGVLDADALVRIAAERGRLMTETSDGRGAMAGIAATPEETEKLIGARPVVIAGLNAPRQTVVAGPADAVAAVIAEAETAGLRATRLPVSHAFHSPQVAPAAGRFAEYLGGENFRPAHRPIVSTVTAEPVAPDTDVRELLRRQVTSPVRFAEAVEAACADADLVIEAGPGRVLSGLVREILPVPVVSMDSDGRSLEGVLRTAAACHVLGTPMRLAALFEGRHVKPLPDQIRLFVNPCETDASEHTVPVATAPTGPVPTGPAPAAPAPTEIRSEFTQAQQHAVEISPGHGEPEDADNVALVRRLAAEHAELPLDAVRPDSALLDELHLSSITVGRLVNDALRVRGLAPPENPLNFATATVQEIAQAMDELAENPEAQTPAAPGEVAGVAPWIGSFVVDHEPAPRPDPTEQRRENGDWRLFAVPDHPLADPLRAALEAGCVGGGVLVCLPPPGVPTDPALMLAGAQAALALDPPGRLVLLHHGADHGAAAMAKTLFLEDPRIDTLVVEAPPVPEAIDWIVAEVAAGSGFVEARYDETGHRSRPWLRAVADPPDGTGPSDAIPLTAEDVLLVTGGGKGITAECALSLAKDTGVRIAVLGRGDPEHDTELAANLDRFSIFGVDFRYVRADVTDAAAVRAAVAEVRAELGPVTAVLHGAGRNVPRRLADLDEDELRSTLAPKVEGLRVLLDAVDPRELRLLVTFGSIIGRAGLAGEAHYAMANAALTEATVEFGRTHPDCRCLALEWSVWSGVGMGERLGAIESLQRGGITPISTDEGLAVLHKALGRPAPGAPEVLVVTGRLNGLPTVAVERRELPVLRFLDRVLVDYPGVELVTEAELSATSDPYLSDHVLEGNLVFPAVAGLEAMAQVACAVTGREERPAFECVEFSRPIAVSPDGAVGIRVAALVRDGSTVEVVIRSAETGFHVDHFRATCRFGGRPPTAVVEASSGLSPIRLDPQRDLYSRVLFQGGRFQRLLGYRRIGATYCAADIGTTAGTREEPWFGRFLPTGLLLGDPGIRDAFMQAIQGSRPDQTLLPVGVDRIAPGPLGSPPSGRLELTGVERHREENAVVWDLTIRDGSEAVVEVWEGLRLQVVRAGSGPLPDALLGPYLERILDELSDARGLRVAVESATGSADRGERTTLAIGRMLGRDVVVRHRPDGRPEVPGADQVSVAHDTDLTVTVTGAGVTCDVEQVAARPDEDWQDLLGADRYALAERLVTEYGDDPAAAATRVWCAAECGQKAGRGSVEPLTDAGRATPDGWVLLRAGEAEIATYVTTRWERDERIAFAFRYPVSAQRESRGAA